MNQNVLQTKPLVLKFGNPNQPVYDYSPAKEMSPFGKYAQETF